MLLGSQFKDVDELKEELKGYSFYYNEYRPLVLTTRYYATRNVTKYVTKCLTCTTESTLKVKLRSVQHNFVHHGTALLLTFPMLSIHFTYEGIADDDNADKKYRRKFDNNLEHPLRAIEQMNCHCKHNPKYISEIKSELEKS